MTDDISVLYVYECVLLERWVYVLCYVSCLSFFLHVSENVLNKKSIKIVISAKISDAGSYHYT